MVVFECTDLLTKTVGYFDRDYMEEIALFQPWKSSMDLHYRNIPKVLDVCNVPAAIFYVESR
jgi:hypothetical protein